MQELLEFGGFNPSLLKQQSVFSLADMLTETTGLIDYSEAYRWSA